MGGDLSDDDADGVVGKDGWVDPKKQQKLSAEALKKLDSARRNVTSTDTPYAITKKRNPVVKYTHVAAAA